MSASGDVPPLFDATTWSIRDERAWTALEDALEEDCDDGERCTPKTPPHLVFDRPRDDALGYDLLRTTSDAIGPTLVTDGLSDLSASGSSQFTRTGLQHLLEALLHRGLIDRAQNVTVFDLRYEPHGEADGQAVSWHVWNNWLNTDMPASHALADEQARLADLARTRREVAAYRICKQLEGHIKQVYYHPEHISFTSTSTEAQSVRGAGLEYVRLPMADHTGAPSDAAVEHFVAYIRARPEQQWWHFHCRKGKGRTSLFMAMLDMVNNARCVSLEDIAARQAALGGVDILKISAHEPHKGKVRRRFARAFHAFCAAGMPGRWSDWPHGL